MTRTKQAEGEKEAKTTGRLLSFPSAPAPKSVARDGYGRPVTHVFGLRISGTVDLYKPFEMRRRGGLVEVFQTGGRA